MNIKTGSRKSKISSMLYKKLRTITWLRNDRMQLLELSGQKMSQLLRLDTFPIVVDVFRVDVQSTIFLNNEIRRQINCKTNNSKLGHQWIERKLLQTRMECLGFPLAWWKMGPPIPWYRGASSLWWYLCTSDLNSARTRRCRAALCLGRQQHRLSGMCGPEKWWE